MKTVLITGADGMLGQDLVRDFSRDHRIVEHDIARGDLCDPAHVAAIVDEAKPDVIVNCAAITDVDGCETKRDLAYAVNGFAARNLAVAANRAGAELLHVSTDFVFPGDKGDEYLEYDEPRPLSVYGDSKLWGEKLVRDHCERFWIVRTQWLYGKNGKNFVETIVGRAREGGPLRVVDDQHGCPTSTVELVRAMRHIVANGGYGVYHASGRGSCSWHGFAAKAVELAGVEGVEVATMKSSELDRAATRPDDSRLRNYHMELTIGDVMKPWEEALAEYLGAAE